jgi:hypothetical protein
MARNYDQYFSEIYAAASRHRFFDPSSGHLAVSEAAHQKVALDEIRRALSDPGLDQETMAKLMRLAATLSNGYLNWLRQLGLTSSSAATSLKRVSAGVLEGFDQAKAEEMVDDEQRRIEKEIFGD